MLLEILSERISLDLFAIIEKLYISMIYGHHIKEKSRPKNQITAFLAIKVSGEKHRPHQQEAKT